MCRFRETRTSSGNWQILDEQEGTVYNIYELMPDTEYELRVLSKNKLGDGALSKVVTGTTSGKFL